MEPDETTTGLSSCDASDACDALGIPAVRTGVFRPLWANCPPLSGPVRSVRLEPGQEGDSPLPGLLDLLAGCGGSVLLVDLGGRVDVQCWGTVLATASKHFGVLGALVNGAARDIDGLRALGLPSYARGVHPAALRGRLRLASVDERVRLDDQTVAPASFVVADASGAVFLPSERAADVTKLAAERADREREQLRSIESGIDPRSALDLEGTPEQP